MSNVTPPGPAGPGRVIEGEVIEGQVIEGEYRRVSTHEDRGPGEP